MIYFFQIFCVILAQCAFSVDSEMTDATITSFNKWANNHGVQGKVEVKSLLKTSTQKYSRTTLGLSQRCGGHGLIALEDIAENDVVVSVPRDLILSLKTPEMIPQIEFSLERLEETLNQEQIIALRMLLIAYSSSFDHSSEETIHQTEQCLHEDNAFFEFSVEDVSQFLIENDLEIFVDAFLAARVNGEMIMQLEMEDLKEMNVGLRIQQKQFFKVRDRIMKKSLNNESCLNLEIKRPRTVLLSQYLLTNATGESSSGSYHHDTIVNWTPWLEMLPSSREGEANYFENAGFRTETLSKLQWYHKSELTGLQSQRLNSSLAAWNIIEDTVLFPAGLIGALSQKSKFSLTFEGFLHAIVLVRSRGRLVQGDTGDVVVVPFADFANHEESLCVKQSNEPSTSNIKETSWRMYLPRFNFKSNRFEIQAARSFQKGEEIKFCYGNFSNVALLHNFGFATLPNPFDTVRFKMSLPQLSLHSGQNKKESYVKRTASFESSSLENPVYTGKFNPQKAKLHQKVALQMIAVSKFDKIFLPLSEIRISPKLGLNISQIALRLVKNGSHGKAATLLGLNNENFFEISATKIPEDPLCALRFHSLNIEDRDIMLEEVISEAEEGNAMAIEIVSNIPNQPNKNEDPDSERLFKNKTREILSRTIIRRMSEGRYLTIPSELRMAENISKSVGEALAKFETSLSDDEMMIQTLGNTVDNIEFRFCLLAQIQTKYDLYALLNTYKGRSI